MRPFLCFLGGCGLSFTARFYDGPNLEHTIEQGCISRVVLRFREGTRNDQMRTILSSNNFIKTGEQGGIAVYGFDFNQQRIRPYPKWFSGPRRDIDITPELSSVK